ncbi:PAAR domain-containing protein [Paraburkholderia sp. J41]|uniref:PAAR domain-containing protein n=1 Tax=Paraburkholderia sp. J41 TaxID=2805433 RepID=UPI002AC34EE3|nr:PAAR domain-containing protein [Paraburkholderia sp. J41]
MGTRYAIRKGDKTTADGVVIAASEIHLVFGEPVAHEGDKVSCPKCHSIGTILCTGDRLPAFGMDARPIALNDDLCLCRCVPPPKLLASQMLFSITAGDGDTSGGNEALSASAAPAAESASLSAVGAARANGASAIAAPESDADGDTPLAARGLSEHDEQECHAQYEADMMECQAYGAMGGSRAR